MKKIMVVLSVVLSICPLAFSRSKLDNAFIEAVKRGDIEIITNNIRFIRDQATYDKALHEAARKGDLKLFHLLRPYASLNGKKKASRSLWRHHRMHCPCHHREICYL